MDETEEVTVEISESDVKAACSETGLQFFEYVKTEDVTSMANLCTTEVRDSFVNSTQTFLNDTAQSGWIGEFYDEYLSSVQFVESTFTYGESTSSTDYKVIVSDYDPNATGSLITYNVTLYFTYDADSETAYINNPTVALELYDDMADGYARYIVDSMFSYTEETSDVTEETEATTTTTEATTTTTTTTVETTTAETAAEEATPETTAPAEDDGNNVEEE